MRDATAFSDDQRELFRSIFDACPEAIAVYDGDGRVIHANRAADEMREQLDVDRLLEGPADDALATFRAALRVTGHAVMERLVAVDSHRPRLLAIEGSTHGPHHVVMVRDVTDRRRLEDELRHLRRVDSVGYLTASVVHDFNNMLTPIVCLSALLTNQLDADSQAGALARDIRLASERAAGVVRQVLSFVRRQPTPPQRVNLSAVVAEMRGLVERVVGEDVAVLLELDDSIGDAILERDQLEQVVLNLAANARDAMPRGGALTLRTADVRLEDDGETRDCPPGGAYVVLTVTDTGTGMTPEVRERIFERFFTTKDSAQGTGLGLATAHRFAEQSGGCISVRTAPGQGTTVILCLPRAAPAPVTIAPPSKEPPRGTETILVVEDDDQVRRVVRAVLEDEGYAVIDAPNGDVALRQIERRRVDLVLTDIVMPGMSGRALVERLERKGHRAKVLFMSGHTDRTIDDHGVPESGRALIRKAFTPAELARRVREVLDETERDAQIN